MAKSKQEEKPAKSADREVSTVIGGVTTNLLDATSDTVDSINSKLAKLQGDLGATIKKFEDGGGNKKAFKNANSIMNMEESSASDYWRALIAYLTFFGFFDQLDMFEKKEGKVDGIVKSARKEQDESKAKGKAEEPKEGAQPKKSTGAQQADAFEKAHGAAAH